MKLVAGHKYLRGTNGHTMPYSELLEKASGYEVFVAKETIVNDMQFPENERMKGAAERAVINAKNSIANKPVIQKKMDHQDIRDEMREDLLES